MPRLPKIILLLLFLIAFISPQKVFSQVTSSGFAVSAPIDDDQAQSGDIICMTDSGNIRCGEEYSTSIMGIITDSPAVDVEDPDLEGSRLIATSGVARVRVNASGGAIAEGDFVTTSETAGVGKKATSNGYVIGVAIEDFGPQDESTIGTIQVLVNIHPATTLSGVRGNLLQFIRSGISVPVFSPVESLRYLLAVLMVLVSFALGMIYFGRASRAGIEAVGRNPLAKRVIQFTVLMNIVLTLVIVMVGIGIAYLILVL